MLPPMALGGISQERFKRGSKNFTCLSWTIGPTNVLDMTSPSVAGQLQNAIKYCTKVRKMGAAGIEGHNLVTVWREITSNDTLNLTVCRDFKVEWYSISPSPTNWWASCYISCQFRSSVLSMTGSQSFCYFCIIKGMLIVWLYWKECVNRLIE